MNFVQQLEECLRDLAAESRNKSKYPGVKEASERAQLKLRTLQNVYVQQVRKANNSRRQQPAIQEASSSGGNNEGTEGQVAEASTSGSTSPAQASSSPSPPKPPTTALFASSELLHPFLLAANYPTPTSSSSQRGLLEISLQGMQLLLAHNAVLKTDGIQLIRVWNIQAQGIVSSYEKQYGLLHEQEKLLLLQQQQQQSEEATSGGDSSKTRSSAAPSSGSSTSWFSWGSGTPSTSKGSSSTQSRSRALSSSTVGDENTTTTTTSIAVKNAVSSSSGSAGGSTASSSASALDRTSKEILSCLLQLLQFMLRNVDEDDNEDKVEERSATNGSAQPPPPLEFWTNATSLAVVWLPVLPIKHTVYQASKSTVQQILHGLFALLNQHHQYAAHTKSIREWQVLTWDDLLQWVLLGSNHNITKAKKFHGALSLCKHLPSRTLGLELLIQLWEVQHPTTASTTTTTTSSRTLPNAPTSIFVNDDSLITKTLSVCMSILQETNKSSSSRTSQNPNHTNNVDLALRISQWTCQLIATLQDSYVNECTELFSALLVPISTATEVCRSLHDFEDGFVYTTTHSYASGMSSTSGGGSSTSTSHTTTPHPSIPSSATCLVPSITMWKASLALEAVYSILERPPSQLSCLLHLDHHAIHHLIGTVSETLSDFAAISASCHDHMLLLVAFAESVSSTTASSFGTTASTNQWEDPNAIIRPFKPSLIRRAEHATTSGNTALFDEIIQVSFHSHGHKSGGITSGATPAASSSAVSTSVTANVLGEALWVSLQGILRIVDCIGSLQQQQQKQQQQQTTTTAAALPLLEDIFAPTLAVLQHYLKRFIGSPDLVHLALSGYASLANICIPLGEGAALQRKALLTSLCKLSLPHWGSHRDHSLSSSVNVSSSHLQDHHIRALLFLFRIVHTHHNSIQQEWDIILWTCEELADLPMASPLLSDEAYHAAMAVSAVLGRFASFTTSFSSDSLLHMAAALTDIAKSAVANRDVVGDSEAVVPQRAMTASADSLDGRETFSEKIMSMGVRAIYGGGSSGASGDAAERATPHAAAQVERTRNSFYEDYRRDFVSRISTTKTAVRVGSIGRLPYSLALLTDTIMANSFRWRQCGEDFSNLLAGLAASSPVVRPYTMDVMSMLTMSHVSNERSLPTPFIGPGRIVFADPMQSQLWAVETVPSTPQLDHALPPSDQASQSQLLSPMCHTIQTTGKADVAESSLGALVSILEGVGHDLDADAWSNVINSVASLSGDPTYVQDRTGAEWSSCCLAAFRCLKFIVDDFLHQIASSNDASSASTIWSLLDCCAAFGRSHHDVNTSLTAIGLLWTIADQDSGSASIDMALSKLVQLAADTRQEVRNAAVNTLFSCIVGKGSTFTDDRWETCFSDCIFAVYNLVANGGATTDEVNAQLKPSRVSLTRHHSTDSTSKLWGATQVLVLRGLVRVLRHFFGQLLDTTTKKTEGDILWFQDTWVRILDFAFEAAGQQGLRDTLDIRVAGVELLVVCCQLSSKAGIQAAAVPARVGTNMEVVNGALRSVREIQPAKTLYERSSSTAAESTRRSLFLESFDGLESYADVIEAMRGTEAVDDSMLQILFKFATGLSQLYECCKGHELANADVAREISSFEASLSMPMSDRSDDDALGRRFVRIVAATLMTATGESTSRFLNQAQRCAISLLQSMSYDGSVEASRQLVILAEPSLFYDPEWKKEAEFGGSLRSAPKLVSVEAGKAVEGIASKDSVGDLCKAAMLYDVLIMFSNRYERGVEIVGSSLPISDQQPMFYKPVVQIVAAGLASVVTLVHGYPGTFTSAKLVWANLLSALSRMLIPTLTNDVMVISRIADLMTILSAARENVVEPYGRDLCRISLSGARKSYEIACQLNQVICKADSAKIERDDADSALSDLANAHVKLLELCFDVACDLQPEDEGLRSLTFTIFSQAVVGETQAEAHFNEEVALCVCRIIPRKIKMESLVISVFSLLCKMVSSSNTALRDATNSIFTTVQLADILQGAQSRYENAERRAVQAEARVRELSHQVNELQSENASLKKDVAVLEASVM